MTIGPVIAELQVHCILVSTMSQILPKIIALFAYLNEKKWRHTSDLIFMENVSHGFAGLPERKHTFLTCMFIYVNWWTQCLWFGVVMATETHKTTLSNRRCYGQFYTNGRRWRDENHQNLISMSSLIKPMHRNYRVTPGGTVTGLSNRLLWWWFSAKNVRGNQLFARLVDLMLNIVFTDN